MQMDRDTGCVSDETRVRDFVSILIFGQKQTLSIVILFYEVLILREIHLRAASGDSTTSLLVAVSDGP